MNCRSGCGACCIAPSMTTPVPGLPAGKPAGLPCVQLTADWRCAIFDQPRRPSCCAGLQPDEEMCGTDRNQALAYLAWLEEVTRPTCAS